MSSVYSRCVRSTPYRDAGATWDFIVDLLTQGTSGAVKTELEAVSGTVALLITDQAVATAPIIVTCNGPRTRIYCLYHDDALDENAANESALGFNPLEGDWQISLPCSSDDLAWVESALKRHSSRITARDLALGLTMDTKSTETGEQAMVLDMGAFLKS